MRYIELKQIGEISNFYYVTIDDEAGFVTITSGDASAKFQAIKVRELKFSEPKPISSLNTEATGSSTNQSYSFSIDFDTIVHSFFHHEIAKAQNAKVTHNQSGGCIKHDSSTYSVINYPIGSPQPTKGTMCFAQNSTQFILEYQILSSTRIIAIPDKSCSQSNLSEFLEVFRIIMNTGDSLEKHGMELTTLINLEALLMKQAMNENSTPEPEEDLWELVDPVVQVPDTDFFGDSQSSADNL